jgi:WD40 repeat protein
MLSDPIRIWDAVSGDIVAGPFHGHTNSVRAVALSSDGKRIISGSQDKSIRIWDAKTGEAVASSFHSHIHGITSVGISMDGRRVVSGSDDKIRTWDVDTGKMIDCFYGHTRSVLSLALSPCGKRVASGSSDHTIRIMNINSPPSCITTQKLPQGSCLPSRFPRLFLQSFIVQWLGIFRQCNTSWPLVLGAIS